SEMKIIIDASTRAAEITRRLLTFGRKTDRRPETIRLRTAIENDLDLLRHTIDRRIQLDCTVPAELPPLWLPGTDLHQVIVNLLLNARDTLLEKLSRDNGSSWNPRISIEASTAPADAVRPIDPARVPPPLTGWVRLTVRDNGLGIPPPILERIFEPFYTTKRVGQGTGLGLATVWHLLTEIGGRIDVESTPGVETAFHVWLPIGASPEAAPKPAAAAPGQVPRESISSRVLVVDDEESISLLVRVILERQGHVVTALSDGRAALDKLSAAPGAFDALLVDFNMPGLTGLELVQRARELPFHGITIVMSGHLGDADRAEFARLGVEHIIQKPFTLTTFVNALVAAGLKPGRPIESSAQPMAAS
ncbi:MAG: response regulator, partial [Verrucomicrobiota bacterium]|nr:response regulator [Verrucomicrobiota bacterium]